MPWTGQRRPREGWFSASPACTASGVVDRPMSFDSSRRSSKGAPFAFHGHPNAPAGRSRPIYTEGRGRSSSACQPTWSARYASLGVPAQCVPTSSRSRRSLPVCATPGEASWTARRPGRPAVAPRLSMAWSKPESAAFRGFTRLSRTRMVFFLIAENLGFRVIDVHAPHAPPATRPPTEPNLK